MLDDPRADWTPYEEETDDDAGDWYEREAEYRAWAG